MTQEMRMMTDTTCQVCRQCVPCQDAFQDLRGGRIYCPACWAVKLAHEHPAAGVVWRRPARR